MPFTKHPLVPVGTYGRLRVVGPVFHRKGLRVCRWVCECGREVIARIDAVTTGHKTSCGCAATDWQRSGHAHLTHGHRHTREYNSWASMKQRCLNPNNPKYSSYGGRGITICSRWRHSFAHFLDDMGRKPSPAHTLNRIDNDGAYTPANCEWALPIRQANNRRAAPWRPSHPNSLKALRDHRWIPKPP